MAKGGAERGGRNDTRQRRALQRLGQDPFDLLGIEAGDGIVLDAATSKVSVVLATDPGLAFSSNKLIALVGAGLELTSSGIEIDLATDPGLEFSTGDLKVKVGDGLELTSAGILIDLASDPGLVFSSGDIKVVVGAGMELTSSGIEIDLAGDPGLEFSSGDIKAKVGNGLELTSDGILIDLAGDPGLAFSSGDLIVIVGAGLELTSSGIEIDLATDPGLEFDSADIRVKIKSSGGITRDSDGLSTTQVLDGGRYVPTLTNIANVTASSSVVATWQRQGRVVFVAFVCTIEANLINVTTEVQITLPVAPAKDFVWGNNAIGVGTLQWPPSDGVSGQVTSVTGAKLVKFKFVPSVTGAASRIFSIMFQYDQDP